jgi:adenosine deaminase
MQTFIHNLPKAELHLHIEGTLEPELMFELAKRNNIELPYTSAEEIRKAYNFHNLQSFLDLYHQGCTVLVTEQDFYDLTLAYFSKVATQNVKHAEIFFLAQSHTERGISFDTVFNGIYQATQEAKTKLGVSSEMILCFNRHLSEEQAFADLAVALPYKDKIIAVGLESSEKGHPPEKFERVFAKAREEGFLTVAHAGEEGPPDYIWQAINLLKVKRIDHGVRCLEDDKLVDYLKAHQIPLTVCPLSNIKLCVFDKIENHCIKKLLDLGLCVLINSDDPSYFDGYIEENYLAVQEAFDLNKAEMAQFAINSFRASFLPENSKAKFISEIEGMLS